MPAPRLLGWPPGPGSMVAQRGNPLGVSAGRAPVRPWLCGRRAALASLLRPREARVSGQPPAGEGFCRRGARSGQVTFSRQSFVDASPASVGLTAN